MKGRAVNDTDTLKLPTLLPLAARFPGRLQLFVSVDVASSRKYSCSSAFKADIRFKGSKVSIFCGGKSSTMLEVCHCTL